MNSEQLFWLVVFGLFNFAAYLVGKHEGKQEGINTTIDILKVAAPDEMKVAIEKFNAYDVKALLVECMKQEMSNHEK